MTSIERVRAALDGAIPGRPAAFGLAQDVDGPEWYPLDGLDAAAWCADDTAVTALGLVEVFGTAVLGRVLAALVLTGSAIDPAELVLHRHERGFVDAVALRRPVLVGPDRAAAAAVTVLGPVLDGIAAATRPAPLWDVVADSVRGAATTLALYGHEGAHDVADELMAALGVPVRPARRETVHATGRRFEVAVRVSCCLLWTTVAAEDRAAAYCTTCPHLDADARATRFTAYAEQAQRQSPAG